MGGLSKFKWAVWKKVKGRYKKSQYIYNSKLIKNKNAVTLLYYDIPNWGDAINSWLAAELSGKPVLTYDIDARELSPPPQLSESEKNTLYMFVGSIVSHADSQTEIWGAGLQQSSHSPRQAPKKIHAVRGPLTAEALHRRDIDCPGVYGDPVLLLPKYYSPKYQSKKYRLGVVAHRKDYQSISAIENLIYPDVKIINMRDCSMSVVDDICACENIISTSLHGLIIADAYGIPSGWAKISDKIPGGNFKYSDYYQSIGSEQDEPDFYLSNKITVNELCERVTKKDLDIDLSALLASCPIR